MIGAENVDPEAIETINDFMVSWHADGIDIVSPPLGLMSRDQALRLAAWLVVVADLSAEHERFTAILKAVERT